jgi:hypothetical protein
MIESKMQGPDRDDSYESLAERYAAGRMTESEQQHFEVRMLLEPALAAEVETIQRMRAGFRVLHERGELQRIADIRRYRRPRSRYALAAATAAVVIAGAVLMMQSRVKSPNAPLVIASSLADLKVASRDALSVPAALLLTHARGSAEPPEIAAAGSGTLALKVLPGVPGSTYSVNLLRLTGAAPVLIGKSVQVKSDAAGYVVMYLNSHRLEPGTYQLSIEQAESSEVFLFRLK